MRTKTTLILVLLLFFTSLISKAQGNFGIGKSEEYLRKNFLGSDYKYGGTVDLQSYTVLIYQYYSLYNGWQSTTKYYISKSKGVCTIKEVYGKTVNPSDIPTVISLNTGECTCQKYVLSENIIKQKCNSIFFALELYSNISVKVFTKTEADYNYFKSIIDSDMTYTRDR